MEYTYADDSFLTVQNKDYAYVGFFAARWAQITVENVEFYETDKSTSKTITVADLDDAKTPSFTFEQSPYSTNPVYDFDLHLSKASGTVTVKIE